MKADEKSELNLNEASPTIVKLLKTLDVTRLVLLIVIIMSLGGSLPGSWSFFGIPFTSNGGAGFFIVLALAGLKEWSFRPVNYILKIYLSIYVVVGAFTLNVPLWFHLSGIVFIIAGFPLKKKLTMLKIKAQELTR